MTKQVLLCLATSLLVTTVLAQPANDNCGGATALTVGTSCSWTAGTVASATASGYAVPCAGTANDDVFYTFTTGATTYSVTVTVAGSANFDAVVQLHTGCPGTNIACADATFGGGTEVLNACVSPSTQYYVRVYDYGSGVPSTPTFNICVQAGTGPSNDCPCGATTLTLGSPTNSSNIGASAGGEPAAPGCWISAPDETVWFTFTTTTAGNYYVHTDFPPFHDMMLAVYSGTCTSLTQIACNDDLNGATWGGNTLSAGLNCMSLSASTTYYVSADIYGSLTGNTFTIEVGQEAMPANDCPIGGTLPNLTALINSISPASGTPFACQTYDYMRPGTGTCSAPTVSTLVGDPNGCTGGDILCAPFTNHYDLWYTFTLSNPVPNVWLNVFDYYFGSADFFALAVYSGTPGGTCGAITGLTQVGCAGIEIVCAGCCAFPTDYNMHGTATYDIGECTTPVSPKFDLSVLSPGTYYLRVFPMLNSAAAPARLNFCIETGAPYGAVSDECPTSNTLHCPDDADQNADVDTTYLNQTNAGNLGNACNTNSNEPLLPIAAPTTSVRVGPPCPLTGSWLTGTGYVNNVMNNTAIYKFSVNGSAGCGSQAEVIIGFENIVRNGYYDNVIQISVMSGSCAGSASIISGWSTNQECLELSSVSMLLANGDYWIVVDGQDGQLCKYDLSLSIQYSGLACDTIPDNQCYMLLPLETLTLTADEKPHMNTLAWTSHSSTPIDLFDIERSADATVFSSVGEVIAKPTSARDVDYGFDDSNVQPGFTYYRVKSMSSDRSYKYSNIAKVYREAATGLALSDVRPNPAHETIQFDYLASDGEAVLEVIDNLGNLILSKTLLSVKLASVAQLDISTLSAGVYFLKLTNTSGDIETRRFIKN